MSIMDFLKNLGGNKEGYDPSGPDGETRDPHRAMVDQIRRTVSQGCRFENAVHPPTVLAALGGSGWLRLPDGRPRRLGQERALDRGQGL